MKRAVETLVEPVELTPCDEVRFVCRTAPTLAVKLTSSGKKEKFKNGVLLLSTAEEVAEMRNAMQTKPSMRQLVRELDVNAADAIARQHRELAEAQRGTSAGGVTGETMHSAMKPTLDDRDNALKAQGINLDEFAAKADEKGGFAMTGKEPMPDRDAELTAALAFKAANTAEPSKEADVAQPGQILGTLGKA